MFIIGLTGGIGSGKSAAAEILKELGLKVIDLDLITHELMRPGELGYIEIKKEYISEIFSKGDVKTIPVEDNFLNKILVNNENLHTGKKYLALLSKKNEEYKLVYRKGLKIDDAIKKSKKLNEGVDDPFLNIFIKSLEVSERGILR